MTASTLTAYAEVVVTLPVEGRFHYSIPEHLEGALELGHRVLVPFRGRRVTGFVAAITDKVPPEIADKVRPILERMDAAPMVPPDVLRLATFTADYYLATPGEVLKLALPPGLTAASTARWVITPRGRHFLDTGGDVLPSGARILVAERQLLEAAVKRQGVKVSGAPAKAAIALEALGLIQKRDSIAARDGGSGEVEVVERTGKKAGAWDLERIFGNKRVVRALWARLEEGPLATELLVRELGKSAKAAIALLEAEGLAARKKVAGVQTDSRAIAGGASVATNSPATAATAAVALPELTEEQAAALEALTKKLEAGESGAFLLHGVTASGKTEVYLRLIADARRRGRGAIVLVPEIALTPQLAARFEARFGGDVVVLHSALSDPERRRRWLRLRRGEAHIALGPRSAVWAPVHDLAVIVVDEEHDPSFKQGSDVRYNGRDLAITRAHQARGVVVLGSATPSLESMQAVVQGKLVELRMAARVANRPLPAVKVVDLGAERSEVGGEPRVLSRALADALRETVKKKGQAILFLNRRGFNTIVFCSECGAARHCARCDVSLTYHKPLKKLLCHYCGHVEPLEAPCKECKSEAMQPFGVGTQRVAEAVLEEVPDARVLRLDRDVTQTVGELDKTLDAFRAREADVLVGTQMVAKGHDFPGVTLVGIVLADASLAFPDFRAAEHTFQLLTQVAGRAGRAEDPGHVVIQTFQPEHYALTSAVHHDSRAFFRIESAARKELEYPPFSRIGLVRFESKEERALNRATELARRAASQILREPGLVVRGPAPAPIGLLRERHREILMIRAPTPARLVSAMRRLRTELEAVESKVDVIYDVDPVDLL